MTCPYTGCDARKGECSGACMTNSMFSQKTRPYVDVKDLLAARHVRQWRISEEDPIQFAEDEPMPVYAKALICIFLFIILAAILVPSSLVAWVAG